MNFDKWTCRASALGLLMTGEYGITVKQQEKIDYLESKLANGKPLTDLQNLEYNELMTKKLNPQLSKTTQSYLRKVWREEKFGRVFLFTNKYVQKGLLQEEESITLLSLVHDKPYLKYKGDRAFGSHFQGQPDIVDKSEGHDVKSSWSLATLPFKDDSLDKNYEYQNLAYMDLFNKERWHTHYCLVNATDQMVYNEKMKFFYSLGSPDIDTDEYSVWIEICKEVEKSMIFDVERFQRDYPGFNWDNEVLDFTIPMEERVVTFTTERDDDLIKEAKERVEASRGYLNSLK